MSDQLPTFDPPKHTDHRALLMRLITPKRLNENEQFMWRLADRQLDEIVDAGHCEFISEFASPFAMLVVADLLGVPESDHDEFRANLAAKGPKHNVGSTTNALQHSPLEYLYEQFTRYVSRAPRPPDRRRAHRAGHGDVPGRIAARGDRRRAHRREPVRRGSGDDRAAARRRAASCSGEQPDLQAVAARRSRARIPNFVEETLRFEGPIKGDFRLARVPDDRRGRRRPRRQRR